MLAVFLKTLPFFALIGLGWSAGRARAFPAEATAWLTRFVFYFALPAMLVRFSATLDLSALFDGRFVAAYLLGSLAVWGAGFAVSRAAGAGVPDAAMQAHTAMTGNTGFLGVPMLVVLLGAQAAGPVLMVLTIDMVLFSTLITLIITGARQDRMGGAAMRGALRGVVTNPMVVSMLAGLGWSASGLGMPGPVVEFLTLLGGAATPGALFAIGASLAVRPVGRLAPAAGLSAAKLVLHPAACAAACALIGVAPGPAGIMIAAAALPVAGNVYILAHYFQVAETRVSAAILLSTAASILTVPLVIHAITKG